MPLFNDPTEHTAAYSTGHIVLKLAVHSDACLRGLFESQPKKLVISGLISGTCKLAKGLHSVLGDVASADVACTVF